MVWDFSNWISAIAALASAAAAYFAFRASEKNARDTMRLEWTREVLAWADDCIAALSEAHSICDPRYCQSEGHAGRVFEAHWKISYLIDRGRLYFENDKSDGYGQHKPSAYQGYAPEMLEWLKDAYNSLSNYIYTSFRDGDEIKEDIIKSKRHFVSLMQVEIDPSWFRKAMTSSKDRSLPPSKAIQEGKKS